MAMRGKEVRGVRCRASGCRASGCRVGGCRVSWPAWAALALAAGCGGLDPRENAGPRPDPRPDTARWQQHGTFVRDLAAKRHPADGAGRATLVDGPTEVRAGSTARFVLRFDVSERGIAEGGFVVFMPEPYWGWSTPHTAREDLPGFTRVTLEAANGAARLEPETFGGAEAGMLVLTVRGGALAEGDAITVDYGAGSAGAYVDRFAGRDARLWFGVDGNGDGVRAIVADSPSVDVVAREAERLVLLGPSVVRPGETARFHVSALDAFLGRAAAEGARVALDGVPEGSSAPEAVTLDSNGFAAFDVEIGGEARGPVFVRARATFPGFAPSEAVANPMVVDERAPRIVWADLHGHSGLSDGTGTPRDYFTYARETARLDVVALTDHDHFGVRFLDATPGAWERIRAETRRAHAPPDFVTVLGYEWTSWVHGHRHVLHFADDGPLLSAFASAAETPADLWRGLRGLPALTFAHHSSGEPVPVNWSYPPDPVLEPNTEITSVHGQSEARTSSRPRPVAGSREGQYVRDQLDRGYRLGFVGSGDSHDGHPGLPHLSPFYGWRAPGFDRGAQMGTGGLAALWMADGEPLDRERVLAALRERSNYATSGPRIAAWTERDGTDLVVRAVATGRFARAVQVLGPVRPGATSPYGTERTRTIALSPDAPEATLHIDLALLAVHTYTYVRLEQTDGSAAWLGPWWE